MEKDIILTGDRPTGNLHIGHYVGSLRSRVEMQNSGKYEMFILIADVQALTDNFDNVEKVKKNILEVALDYLAVGLEIDKVHFVLQSYLPSIFELPMYYANLVTQSRLERNPTVKNELKSKNFGKSVPVGFVNYPISQAADITAFMAKYVPVGEDQLPMIEQTREIVQSFNRIYGETLVMPEGILPKNEICYRLVGTDGNAKMGKSLDNCIYLKDSEKEIERKVMSMYTDPNHINVNDKGSTKNNPVFIYLEAFSKDEDFAKYCPEYKNLDEMKAQFAKQYYMKEAKNILAKTDRKSGFQRVDSLQKAIELLMKGKKHVGVEDEEYNQYMVTLRKELMEHHKSASNLTKGI